MKKALLPLLPALAVVAATLWLAGPDTTSAHRRECPRPPTSGSHSLTAGGPVWGRGDADYSQTNDKQGKPDKHTKLNCRRERPTPTPAPTPSPTPAPTPSPTPVPPGGADVKLQSVAVTTPTAATAGVQFLLLADVNLHNNGPDGDVNVDTTFTLHLPADCTITNSTTVVVLNRSLPMSVPVFISRAWNVTCTQTGLHQFTVDSSVAISAGQTLADPNLANNSGSGSGTTTVS